MQKQIMNERFGARRLRPPVHRQAGIATFKSRDSLYMLCSSSSCSGTANAASSV